MIFFFFGFDPIETDRIMPILVSELGLGHPKYSAIGLGEVSVYDSDGKKEGTGRAIWVPGFQKIRENPHLLTELSSQLGNIPITMISAPVAMAIGDELY